jgi:chitin disaccharide deacetylase
MTAQRHICIAVDDFGLHAGVCGAALRLAHQERVHAIGCMVGGAAWPAWHKLLHGLDGLHVDLGLHLDFTEHPLTLTPRPLGRLVADNLMHLVDRRAIRKEIIAQLDAFERCMGRGPAFVDGHQHVHQFPRLRDELLAELQLRYAGSLPWLRSTRARHPEGKSTIELLRTQFKPWVIESLGAAGLARIARGAGISQNAHLMGVYNFKTNDAAYLDKLADWFTSCGEADLLMCHPSLTLHADDPIGNARCSENRVLSGEAFETLRVQQHIVLQPMSQILARHSGSATR